jgi:carboxymethylenebutenolidase
MTQSSRITIDVNTGTTDGILARPGQEKAGVIVLQEWWGIVPHIEDVVRRFAAHGFVALAPDLYHGKSTLDAEEASHLMNGLDWGRAAGEIAAAVRHLREVEGCTRVGIAGFCMGGALAMIGAAVADVDAYAAFYGFPPAGGADLSKVSAPGILFFGEHEGFFSVPDAQAFAAAQSARDIPTEVVVYPGAGHAFFNDTRPEVFDRNAANDAWRRTLALFSARLRG